MEFESYLASDGKVKSGVPKAPLKEIGDTNERGTTVTFLPDKRVFGELTFSYDIIARKYIELYTRIIESK